MNFWWRNRNVGVKKDFRKFGSKNIFGPSQTLQGQVSAYAMIMLKATPFFDQHLLKNVPCTGLVFGGVHSLQLSDSPPAGTLCLVMFAALLARLSFPLNSSCLPEALNGCPASVCTSRIRIGGIV